MGEVTHTLRRRDKAWRCCCGWFSLNFKRSEAIDEWLLHVDQTRQKERPRS